MPSLGVRYYVYSLPLLFYLSSVRTPRCPAKKNVFSLNNSPAMFYVMTPYKFTFNQCSLISVSSGYRGGHTVGADIFIRLHVHNF